MMPDKVYLKEGHAEPIVGFVSPAWNNPKDLENPIEYIRKGALLEWLRKTEDEALNEVPMLDVLTLQKVIDKLNEM